MGETDNNVQDPASVKGDSSTSEDNTPTLTETQAKERETKAVSDALAAAGRTATKLTQRETAVKVQEDSFKTRQDELDARDRELTTRDERGFEGNAEAITGVQARQQLRADQRKLADDQRKLDQDKLTHQADIDAANATKKEITIWEIAQKYGVDANALKELNLDTPEQIESVAKAMSAGKAPKKPGEKETKEPDSGKTKGGGEPSDEAKLKARFPKMP